MERWDRLTEFSKNCTVDRYSSMHINAYASAEGGKYSFPILRSLTLMAHPAPRSSALILSACNDLKTFKQIKHRM